MRIEQIVTTSAYLALSPVERDALLARLGGGLELDASAIEHFDGDAARLSVADLRRWLIAWDTRPFAFVSVDGASALSTSVCEALLVMLAPEHCAGDAVVAAARA